MRYVLIAGAASAGLAFVAWTQLGGGPAKTDPTAAEVDAVRQELKAVRAEAEVARLKANAGVKEEKSFLKSPLEGKWVSTLTSSHTVEFFPDGTYQENTRLVTVDGAFAVLDGNRLKMTSRSWLGDEVRTVKWAVDGGRLTIEQEGGVMRCAFTRQ